jgi:hypothetical protein
MSGRRDFDELVAGEGLDAAERARLERVHELLIDVGPPPELPPSLARAPRPHAEVSLLPRRRRISLALVAAALALAAFGAGYLTGGRGAFHAAAGWKPIPMRGTAAARGASAKLIVGDLDAAGNWPLRMDVRGLKPLPHGGYYEMLLLRKGEAPVTCGAFVVHPGKTTVYLNAPYRLNGEVRWIVVRRSATRPTPRGPVLLTT